MSKPEDNLGDHAKKGSVKKKRPFDDPEVASAASKRGHKAKAEKKIEVEKLLEEAGYEPGEAPETIRQLALSAVRGAASDMRLWLQQTGQLTKGPEKDWDGQGNCPTCGLDPAGGLVISADDVGSMERAIDKLEEIAGYGVSLPDATLIADLPEVEDKQNCGDS